MEIAKPQLEHNTETNQANYASHTSARDPEGLGHAVSSGHDRAIALTHSQHLCFPATDLVTIKPALNGA